MDIYEAEKLSLKLISRSLDIKLFYWEEKSQAILYDDMSAIFIDNRISPQLQWQDFCHEMCHVLIHSGDQINMPPLFREYQEFKANNFMYHACVPTFMLEELDLYDCTAHSINYVQQLFNVEYEFAKIRLENYINKKIYVTNKNSRFD